MAQKRSLAYSELKVGILVIVAFVALSIAVLKVGGQTNLFGKKIEITAYFPSANGLREGGEVWVDGILVGNVKDVKFTSDPNPLKKVAVVLRINDEFKSTIREDSLIGVETIGLLGEKSIQISSGPGKGKPIADGGSIYGKEAGDISSIISGTDSLILNLKTLSERAIKISDQVSEGKGTLGKLLNDSELNDNLNKTVLEMNSLIHDIRTGPGTMGQLINDDTLLQKFNSTMDKMDSLMSKIDHGDGTVAKLLNDHAVMDRMDKLLERTDNILSKVENGQGSLGKLVNDDGLVNDMHKTMGKVDGLVDAIQSGDGTMGKLVKDPSLFNTMNQAVSEMQKLMYDIKQDPKKYLTINFRFF